MRILKSVIFASALIAGGVAATSQASAAPVSYTVQVTTSFGTKFTDCFSFSKGILTVAGYGTLVYAAAPTVPKQFYSAVSPIVSAQAAGFAIDFAGFKKGTLRAGSVHAVGNDEMGDSYLVNGVSSTCGGVAPTGNGAQYRPAQ